MGAGVWVNKQWLASKRKLSRTPSIYTGDLLEKIFGRETLASSSACGRKINPKKSNERMSRPALDSTVLGCIKGIICQFRSTLLIRASLVSDSNAILFHR